MGVEEDVPRGQAVRGNSHSRRQTDHGEVQQTTLGDCSSSTELEAMRNWKQQDGGEPGSSHMRKIWKPMTKARARLRRA